MGKIAENISKLMFQFGMTQTELAVKTGIAQPVIHRLMSSKNANPKLQTLLPIADYFEVTVGQLLGEARLPKIEINIEKTGYHQALINLPFLSWQETSEITSYRRLKILQDRCKKSYLIDKKLAEATFVTTMPSDNKDLYFSKSTKNISLVVSPQASYQVQQMILLNNRCDRELKIRQLIEYKDNEHALFVRPSVPNAIEVLKQYDYIIGKIMRLVVDY